MKRGYYGRASDPRRLAVISPMLFCHVHSAMRSFWFKFNVVTSQRMGFLQGPQAAGAFPVTLPVLLGLNLIAKPSSVLQANICPSERWIFRIPPIPSRAQAAPTDDACGLGRALILHSRCMQGCSPGENILRHVLPGSTQRTVLCFRG